MFEVLIKPIASVRVNASETVDATYLSLFRRFFSLGVRAGVLQVVSGDPFGLCDVLWGGLGWSGSILVQILVYDMKTR